MAATTTSIKTVFPMDSVVESTRPDGLPVYDRPYNASDLREVAMRYVTDGLCTDYLDELLPSLSDGTWSVGAGAAVAHGLLIRMPEARAVIGQADIGQYRYAHIVLAARFSTALRDGALYAVVTTSPDYVPVRDSSTWELVLATVDWRGSMTDRRLERAYCGAVAPVVPVDTDSFIASLKTALSQFDVSVGEVSTLPGGAAARVSVRKPTRAGEPVCIDFGIPRGAPGQDGADGVSRVSVGSEEPEMVDGAVWFHEPDSTSKVVDELRVLETVPVYPDTGVFPDTGAYPDGRGAWVRHRLSADLIAS